jgi:hypothetical protein
MRDHKKFSNSMLLLLIAGVVWLLPMAQPATAAFLVTPDGYWQLEETDPGTSGVVDDLGAVNGSCTTCPSSTTGQVGLGFDFSASNAEVNFADNTIFDFAADANFSIELWMKIAANPASRQVIIGRFESGASYWWLSVETDGTVGSQFIDSGGGSPSTITTTADVADDAWHHVVAVLDRSSGAGGQILIYIDGALAGTQDLSAVNNGDFLSSAAVNLGHFNSGFYFAGQVDNIAIYSSSALTADEVQQNFNSGSIGVSLDADVAPAFTGARSETAAVGFTASYTASAVGKPLPTYSSSDLPDGATIDDTSGLITWLPTDLQIGDNTFTVTATNSQGTADQNWTVNVADLCVSALDSYWKLEENGGPFEDFTTVVGDATCTDCPTQVAGKVGFGQSFDASDDQVDIPANDVFNWADTTSFSIELWMKIASDPGARQVMIGRYESGGIIWWISVEDGGTVGAEFRDSGGDSAATITTATNVADDAFHHVVAVLDRDAGAGGQILIYIDGELEGTQDLTAANNGDFISTSSAVTLGYLNVSPFYQFGGTLDEVATYNIALGEATVKGHFNAADDQSYCNSAPTINSTPVTTATQGVAYSYTATATDPETHGITWSLAANPTGMTIDANTGAVSWTPDSSASASEDVEVVATDEFGATDSQTFTIAVTLTTNNAPVITSTGPTTATVGTAYTYTPTATDADTGDTLTWSLDTGAPTGMSVDSATGQVTWTPDTAGDFSYTLNVTDAIDTVSQTVSVTVSEAGTEPAAETESSGGGGGGGCFIDSLF